MGIPSWAVAGQRVVHLGTEDGWRMRDSGEPVTGPYVGQVTTIRYVWEDEFGDAYLAFIEFASGSVFNASYFRPVDEREVERELFMARLCGADAGELVR